MRGNPHRGNHGRGKHGQRNDQDGFDSVEPRNEHKGNGEFAKKLAKVLQIPQEAPVASEDDPSSWTADFCRSMAEKSENDSDIMMWKLRFRTLLVFEVAKSEGRKLPHPYSKGLKQSPKFGDEEKGDLLDNIASQLAA
jgi:hypothetical protein